MVYTGPRTSINTGPKKKSYRVADTGHKVNPHDPDQEEQTADIARDEILSHYPQVKPQPDLHPVKDRGNSRIHPFGDAIHIFIVVWHFCGCDTTQPSRDVNLPDTFIFIVLFIEF